MLEPEIVTKIIKCKVYTNDDYSEFLKGIRARVPNKDSGDSHDTETIIQQLNSTPDICKYVKNFIHQMGAKKTSTNKTCTVHNDSDHSFTTQKHSKLSKRVYKSDTKSATQSETFF